MAERNVAANDRVSGVVVATEDLTAAFRRTRDDADDRQHVLRVAAPFTGEARADLAVTDEPDRTAAPPFDLPPALFVENYRGDDPERTTVRIPTRADARRAARTDHGDDVDERTVEDYFEREMAVWRDCVRDSLVDEVLVGVDPESGTETWTDVRYEPPGED